MTYFLASGTHTNREISLMDKLGLHCMIPFCNFSSLSKQISIMKKTKLIHQAWMKKILNGRENIVIRPTPRSKSYLYRYMIIERMVLYYRQKLTLILE